MYWFCIVLLIAKQNCLNKYKIFVTNNIDNKELRLLEMYYLAMVSAKMLTEQYIMPLNALSKKIYVTMQPSISCHHILVICGTARGQAKICALWQRKDQ